MLSCTYTTISTKLVSRRLERECGSNLELWLTGRLNPDFETIANFRQDNAPSLQ